MDTKIKSENKYSPREKINLLRHENECSMKAVYLILSQEYIYPELCRVSQW